MEFDPATLQLHGVAGFSEILNLRVSASNAAGESLTSELALTILDGSEFEIYNGTSTDDFAYGPDAVRTAMFGNGGNDFLSSSNKDDFLRLGNEGGSADAGSGNDILIGGTDSDDLVLAAGNDYADGQAGDDNISGGNGDDVLIGGPGNDILDDDGVSGAIIDFIPLGSDADPGVGEIIDSGEGELFRRVEQISSSNDILLGGSGDDELSTRSGDDRLFGGPGNDLLYGDAGNDLYNGGSGDDFYSFYLDVPQGRNLIVDEAGLDTVRFEYAGQKELKAKRSFNNLVLEFDPQTAFTLQGWYTKPDNRIERVEVFSGDSFSSTPELTLNPDQLETLAGAISNRTPKRIINPDDRTFRQESNLFFTLPAGTFTDEDPGDTLTLSAALSSGAPLPSWLQFDPESGAFTGIPTAAIHGPHSIQVTATDLNGATAQATFTLHIDSNPSLNYVQGDAGDNDIMGSSGNDVIRGGPGQDNLMGGAGSDIFVVEGNDIDIDSFNGGSGFDRLLGGEGDDTLRLFNFVGANRVEQIDGGNGLNIIAGSSGSNRINLTGIDIQNIHHIDLGDGHDRFTGSVNNEIIIGGRGQDYLSGGAGDDTFMLAGTDQNFDTFSGGPGVDLILGSAGDDTVRLRHFMGINTVEKIDGAGGINTLAGTPSADTFDLSATEVINIHAIDLGAGRDSLIATPGDDRIIGGPGADTLQGGAGNDRYEQQRGDGVDLISDSAGVDTVAFKGDIRPDQLWFERQAQDLHIQTLGGQDQLTIQDWYADPDQRIESFTTSDGGLLVEANIQQLVEAMAVFAPPTPGQISYAPEIHQALTPVLAATWQN